MSLQEIKDQVSALIDQAHDLGVQEGKDSIPSPPSEDPEAAHARGLAEGLAQGALLTEKAVLDAVSAEKAKIKEELAAVNAELG